MAKQVKGILSSAEGGIGIPEYLLPPEKTPKKVKIPKSVKGFMPAPEIPLEPRVTTQANPNVAKGILSAEAAEYLKGASAATPSGATAAPSANPWAQSAGGFTGKGLLSGIGKVAGGAGAALGVYELAQGANKAFNPVVRAEALQNASDQIGSDRNARENPESLPVAKEAMKGMADRAVGSVKGITDNWPRNQPQMNTGPVVASKVIPQVSPEKAAAVEGQRQTIEAGAKTQLAQGELSRPKAAEAVVQADIQRSGENVTPDEFKARVAEETASMKAMDNDDLSKYLSYALVAGGLIAAALDESGQAGNAFAGGFNAQLDRNQTAAMFKAKQEAEAAANASEAYFKGQELGLKTADTRSKIEDREADNTRETVRTQGQLDKWEAEAANADAKLAAYRDRTAATGASSTKDPKGTPLSDKENLSAINAYADVNGMEVDPAAASSMANQLKFLQKERPGQTMKAYMETLFKMGGYVKSREEGLFSDTTTLKLE